MTKMMANQSFDSVQSYGSCVHLQNALYGCPVRLFVLKTSKQLPNKARKKNKKKRFKTIKKNITQKKHVFFYISIINTYQGCALGLDVSVSRRSRDAPLVSSRLVSTIFSNISVSSRSREPGSRVSSRSRGLPSRSLNFTSRSRRVKGKTAQNNVDAV
mgnify:CR=1 FL=1